MAVAAQSPMEEIKEVASKRKEDAGATMGRIEELNEEIAALNKELEENYAMPRTKIAEKKRLLVKLNAERARLSVHHQ